MDLNFLAACEDLASNVQVHNEQDQVVTESDALTWQQLFNLSPQQAIREIQGWRENLGRQTISPEAWLLVREEKESQGYTKEAYEYSLTRLKSSSPATTVMGSRDFYLLKAEGPWRSLDDVSGIINVNKRSIEVYSAQDENQVHQMFYRLNAIDREKVICFSSKSNSTLKPFFVRDARASKDLCNHSWHPRVGREATLPQFRTDPGEDIRPMQKEYPVWYFFYGTLMDAKVLVRLLGPKQNPTYEKAFVRGGSLRTWAHKNLELISTPSSSDASIVEGCAYLVQSEDEEQALRAYESDHYTVARCLIEFADGGKKQLGLTFTAVSS